jgi:hypothetical protein
MNNLMIIAKDDGQWKAIQRLATAVSAVPGFAYFKKPNEALLVAMKANDMGLSFTEALEQVYVINGKTAIQGQLMLSKIRKEGHRVTIKENSKTKAVIECQRKDEKDPSLWSFDLEDAKAANLLSKDNWRKYPSDMLLWRAVARACRFQFSDCVGGSAHLPDEIGVDEERDVSNFTPPEDNKSDLTNVFTEEKPVMESPEVSPAAQIHKTGNDASLAGP